MQVPVTGESPRVRRPPGPTGRSGTVYLAIQTDRYGLPFDDGRGEIEPVWSGYWDPASTPGLWEGSPEFAEIQSAIEWGQQRADEIWIRPDFYSGPMWAGHGDPRADTGDYESVFDATLPWPRRPWLSTVVQQQSPLPWKIEKAADAYKPYCALCGDGPAVNSQVEAAIMLNLYHVTVHACGATELDGDGTASAWCGLCDIVLSRGGSMRSMLLLADTHARGRHPALRSPATHRYWPGESLDVLQPRLSP